MLQDPGCQSELDGVPQHIYLAPRRLLPAVRAAAALPAQPALSCRAASASPCQDRLCKHSNRSTWRNSARSRWPWGASQCCCDTSVPWDAMSSDLHRTYCMQIVWQNRTYCMQIVWQKRLLRLLTQCVGAQVRGRPCPLFAPSWPLPCRSDRSAVLSAERSERRGRGSGGQQRCAAVQAHGDSEQRTSACYWSMVLS
jgi:hypothetical protein